VRYDIDAQARCLGLVSGIIETRGFNTEDPHELAFDPIQPGPEFQVFIVSFSYILGNYKALISSTLPDSRYYEVTYNKAKDEHYIDVYVKAENVAVSDGALKAPLN